MAPLLHALLSPPPTLFLSPKPLPHHRPLPLPHLNPRCSLRAAISTEQPPARGGLAITKPSPAELSRTVMELASAGTLSAHTPDGWPLGVGARFVADAGGAPALCLHSRDGLVGSDARSSFHVMFEQSGLRTPQCTLLDSCRLLHFSPAIYEMPTPSRNCIAFWQKLRTRWEKKFGEEIDADLLHLISVERIFHREDFNEDGIWVAPSEYLNAEPDPLRNFAVKIVDEMNSRYAEDVCRLCNVYVESGFQATDAKMIWVDKLGFDLHMYSEKGVFAVRIPFPREVADEKGVKSSFNLMAHLAWEVDKNYVAPDFEKVSSLKKIR